MYKAYEVLSSCRSSETAVKVFINGRVRSLEIEKIVLKALSVPSNQRATIKLLPESFSIERHKDIYHNNAKQLIIQGKVVRVIERDMLINVEKAICVNRC